MLHPCPDNQCARRLGIPDTDYSATVRMPSGEFQRIVKCARVISAPYMLLGLSCIWVQSGQSSTQQLAYQMEGCCIGMKL